MAFISQLLTLYAYAVIARIILSYFPVSQGGVAATIYNALFRITEPVLGPLRRVIPPMGMFDFSPMILVFGLFLLAGSFH